MQYMGGKYRLRKQISSFLESIRQPNQPYLEPFVGGAHVLSEMSGERYASDLCEPLVALYTSLIDGWIPPTEVSLEDYLKAKELPPTNPMNAFCGFGCSYGGAYFSSYVPVGKKDHARISHDSLLKQLPKIKDVKFSCQSYDEYKPDGMLIYCDPPYKGTRRYISVDKFDHDKFWNVMRDWSKCNTVVISEYSAPDDFECITEFKSKSPINKHKGANHESKNEKLFMIKK